TRRRQTMRAKYRSLLEREIGCRLKPQRGKKLLLCRDVVACRQGKLALESKQGLTKVHAVSCLYVLRGCVDQALQRRHSHSNAGVTADQTDGLFDPVNRQRSAMTAIA